jgi:phage protein D
MKTSLLAPLVLLAATAPAAAAPLGATLFIDGARLSRRDLGRIERVVVEQAASTPDECVIELRIGKDEPAEFPFDVGSALEIRLDGGTGAEAFFKGEIAAIEAEYEKAESTVVVRGFDRLHRLRRGRRTKTWEDVSDADLAARIAAEHGLQSDVEPTGLRSAYVFQNNQTDLDFLRRRAERVGFEIDVEDDVLRFRRAPDPSGDPLLAIAGPRAPMKLVTTDVPGPLEVIVRGWDPVQKAPLTGMASGDGAQSGAGESFALERGDVLSEEPLLSEALLFSQAEADAAAAAVLQQRTARSTTVQGEGEGDPRIRPGTIVEVTGVGSRFEGKYLVTGATHRFERSGGYLTRFVVERSGDE